MMPSLAGKPSILAAPVARKNLLRLAQRGFEQIFGEHRAIHEAVKTVAGVVAVQGDDAWKACVQISVWRNCSSGSARSFQNSRFQVFAAPRNAGVVLEARSELQTG